MMTISLDSLSWEELPDMMTIEEFRRFTRQGDRQARDFAKEADLEIRMGNSVRVSKAALANYLCDELDGVESNFLEFSEEAQKF